MKNNIIKEVSVALVLVTFLIVILNPFNIWMPNMMHIAVLVCVFIVFGIFAAFVLREKARDERELAHRALAGRASFLAGSGILMLGVLVQGLHGIVDPWLILSLVIMILTKIGVRLYGDMQL